MRIAYVHYMGAPGSQKGGPGVHIAESVRGLCALGHTVAVHGPELDVSRAPVATGATASRGIVRHLAARFGYEPRALVRSVARGRALTASLRAERPDVIVARYEAFELAPLLASRRLGVPLVWEVNGTSREIGWWNDELAVYPGTIALERAVFHAAAAVFVVSDELRAELVRDGVDARRVAVIPNGADPGRFRPEARDAAIVDLPSSCVVVGFLGSFSRWHDALTMARAVAEVAAVEPDVRFVLAGAAFDDMPAAVREILAPLRTRLVLPGVVPIATAPAWIARFDVALSLYPALEPFYFSPVKLFEYLASGPAVVATAIGQQATVIRDGVNGRLVPPGDVDAVVGAIRELVASAPLRARLGAAGRETVARDYTWAHNAKRIASLCDAALAAQRGGRRVAELPAGLEPVQ